MQTKLRLLHTDLLAKGMTRSVKIIGVPINYVVLNTGIFSLLTVVSYLASQSYWSIFIALSSLLTSHLVMMWLSLKEERNLSILFSNVLLCKTNPLSETNSYTSLTSSLSPTLFKEQSIAKHLPWSHLYDEHTVITKKGELIQVLTLEGLSFYTESDHTLDDNKAIRNRLLYQIANPHLAISFYTIKKPHAHFPLGNYPPGYAKHFNNRYEKKFKEEKKYQHFIYIVLQYKAPILGLKPKGNGTQRNQKNYFAKGIKALNEYSSLLMSVYQSHGCRRLGKTTTPYAHSEVLSFLSYLVNLEERLVREPLQSIHTYIGFKSHHFAKRRGIVQVRGVDGRDRFAAMLSLKEYPEETHSCLLDVLLKAKCEFIAVQSFFFKHNREAQEALHTQQRKMQKANDSVFLAQKMDVAIEELKAGMASYGEHHLSLCVIADDIVSLNKSVFEIESKMNQEAGLLWVREEQGSELAFWAQLPGNQAYRIRQSLISSLNVAGFANLHNYPIGKHKGNHWGEAITVLETISGTPYYFNIHVGQVGNSIFIGPMGSGKTLLLSAILALSVKFGGWRFVFDKDRGMEIVTRALNGQYNFIEPGKPSGMAPLQLKDTPENRAFNRLLFKKILSIHTPLTPQEEKRIEKAIEGIYELAPQERSFRNLAPFLGVAEPQSLRERFDRWHTDGQYAWLFDNPIDSFAISNKITGFDIGKLLSVGCAEVSTPALMYLFHRISECLDSQPTIVFIPEGWKALSDPLFQEQLRDWSKTPRKNNMAMLMDTQSPEDLALSPAGCAIVSEARTQVFFANQEAKWEHYKQFALTEREFEIIKDELPALGGHFFLLKQNNQSTVVRLNLTGLQEDIAILSTNLSRALLLDKIRQRTGDAFESWASYYRQLSTRLEENHRNAMPEFEQKFDEYWEQCE